jgi:hypothetical protein
MTVIVIIVLVPIIVFAITHFVTSALVRYSTQNRNVKAEYLAQAGIQRAIYNIESGAVSPYTNVGDFGAGDTITVTDIPNGCSGIYQMWSKGTSISSSYPAQVSRVVFAQYNANTNTVNRYLQGDGTGVPLPACCDAIWWPFDSVVAYKTDASPVNLTYQGTLTPSNANAPDLAADRYGMANRALAFNSGSQVNYVFVPDSDGLDLTTEGTLMAWVWINTTVTGAGVIHKGGSTNPTKDYALILDRQNNNNSRVQIVINGTTIYEDNNNISRRVWHHVAGSWGSNGMRTYLDGRFIGGNSTQPTARTNSEPLYIGTAVASGRQFEGTIDEVYVYACQKTDQEILDYYNASKP